MLPLQVALVSEVKQVKPPELCRVSAALQRQVARDFGPIWQINATVDAFVSLEDVPVGYWPMIVETQLDQPGAAGIHLDKDGQPFSLIEYNDTWSLTASHECLEMLADPFGNRLAAGQSPKSNQGRVEFLVEVADPCEAVAFSYRVNGQVVSDFYTPNYFDPIKSGGTRYSFSGAVTAPGSCSRAATSAGTSRFPTTGGSCSWSAARRSSGTLARSRRSRRISGR